jgi:hypothetical protein
MPIQVSQPSELSTEVNADSVIGTRELKKTLVARVSVQEFMTSETCESARPIKPMPSSRDQKANTLEDSTKVFISLVRISRCPAL